MSSLNELKEQFGQIGQRKTNDMRATEIESKLSSKKDWYMFLEQNL